MNNSFHSNKKITQLITIDKMEEYPEYFEGKGAIQRKFKDGTRKSVKAKNKYFQKNRQDDEEEETPTNTLPQKWSAKNFTPSSSEAEEDNEEIIEKMVTPLKQLEIEEKEVHEERYSMDEDTDILSENSDHSSSKKKKKEKKEKKNKKEKKKDKN